jgi:hypothetical protein
VGLHTRSLDGSDVVQQPSLWHDTVGNEAELPLYVMTTDASGQDFDNVGAGTLLGPDRMGADATSTAPEGIEPGREHRFRLEVPLVEEPRVGVKVSEKPGPFVFDFEIPVRPAPTIELNQRVRGRGGRADAKVRGRLTVLVCRLGGARGLRLSLLLVVLRLAYPAHHPRGRSSGRTGCDRGGALPS